MWIVGDSIVRWAEGPLGIPIEERWHGKSGAQLCDIPQLLPEIPSPAPSVLVVHIGTNDMVQVEEFSFRQGIVLFMRSCATLFPHDKLIWSDILRLLHYFGARSQTGLERKHHTLNRWARSPVSWFGVSNLHHPQFRWTESALYRFDAVHLSPTGNRLFRENVCRAHSALM